MKNSRVRGKNIHDVTNYNGNGDDGLDKDLRAHAEKGSRSGSSDD